MTRNDAKPYATTRTLQPELKRFSARRILGAGDLWITEYVITYDGRPSYTVSIMEFSDGKVRRETQYFGDPFEASAWRAQWVGGWIDQANRGGHPSGTMAVNRTSGGGKTRGRGAPEGGSPLALRGAE